MVEPIINETRSIADTERARLAEVLRRVQWAEEQLEQAKNTVKECRQSYDDAVSALTAIAQGIAKPRPGPLLAIADDLTNDLDAAEAV